MASPGGGIHGDPMGGEHLKERNQEIVRLYVEELLTVAEVGARLRLSPSGVWHILARAGVNRRKPGPRPTTHLRERNDEIARAYAQEGLTLEGVGRRFGLSPSGVWHILARAGVNGRRGGPPCGSRWRKWTRRNDEIARLYAERDLTLREIGERFGLTSSAVYYVLQKGGVSRRKPGPRPTAGSPGQLRERNHEIARLYVEEGLSPQELGARFGLGDERIRQIVRRPREREVARLYAEERLTVEGFGARFALTRGRVRQILGGVGVGLRRASSGPAPPPHLKERDGEIARLYAERDLTLREIGERFGLTRERVRQIAGRAGLAPAAGVKRKRNQEIIRLYVEEGLAASGVGARLGMTKSAVFRVLERAGVPRRSGGWRSSWPWRDAAQRSDEIARAYVEEGSSPTEIALRFGVSRGCVHLVLCRSGAKRPSSDIVAANQEVIRTYLEEGLTRREVAERFGLTPWRVSYILQMANVRRGQPSAK